MRFLVTTPLAVTFSLAMVASPAAAQSVVNGGFADDNAPVASPSGWTSSGSVDADFTEWGGHSADYRLSHWSGADYLVDTSQVVRYLGAGFYTLRGFVRRSTGDNDGYIELDCGLGARRVALPVAWPDQWLEIAVSAAALKGHCRITLHTRAAGGEWSNFDDISLVPGAVTLPVRGADVSSLKKSEDLGGTAGPI